MLATHLKCIVPHCGSSDRVVAYEYDDQFVPILTPCSAASLRLKNIRFPVTHRIVGLPTT